MTIFATIGILFTFAIVAEGIRIGFAKVSDIGRKENNRNAIKTWQ